LDRNGFYLLFVPALTVAAMLTGFLMAAFAMTQGEFRNATKRGLVSLAIMLVAITGLFLSARRYPPELPNSGHHVTGRA
jgi:hypothetical protein